MHILQEFTNKLNSLKNEFLNATLVEVSDVSGSISQSAFLNNNPSYAQTLNPMQKNSREALGL